MEKSDARNYRTMLLDEMKSGQFSRCSKLPRETELADMLSISRTQLRDVLSELDPGRQDFVLNQISGGQVFITCCEPGRFTKLGKTIEIANGQVVIPSETK